MERSILTRIPVVAGLAYIERLRRLPPSFVATLAIEPDNRYFRHAISVSANGEKIGYVAPEIARGYYEPLKKQAAAVTCPARKGGQADRETSGVEVLLDFSALPVRPE
jgi:hypothetical protein